MQTVHFFVQQYYLESTENLFGFGDYLLSPQWPGRFGAAGDAHVLDAKKIVLTFRRSDWWSWESPPMSNDQLAICPWRRGRTDWKQMEAEPLGGPNGKWQGWGGQFHFVRGLEMLEIEFETVLTKKRQLERVVERAKHWKFPLQNDRVLAWTGVVKGSMWEGALKLEEDYGDRLVRLRSVHEDTEPVVPPKCSYVVMTMIWRVAQREKADCEGDEMGRSASRPVLSPSRTESPSSERGRGH